MVVVTVVIAFASGAFGSGGSKGTSSDNSYPTSLQTVQRRDLSSQTQVNATLAYADSTTIVVPAGTAPTAVAQAAQAVTTATAQLATARTSAASDGGTLTEARATLAADRQKLAVDCAGDNAGQAPAAGSGSSAAAGSPCASDQQAETADEQAVAQAEAKTAGRLAGSCLCPGRARRGSLRSCRGSVVGNAGRHELDLHRSAGDRRDHPARPDALRGERRTGRSALRSRRPLAVVRRRDVAGSRCRRAEREPARSRLRNRSHRRRVHERDGRGDRGAAGGTGRQPNRDLLLGAVVFEPSAVRVTSVTPTLGATVQPGPVLTVTSTRRVVTIALDAAEQTSVKVGDPVEITLPDQSTTSGRVTYVGTVATTPSSSDQGNGNGASTPTIEVDVTPTDPAATGRLDQAPVLVAITTASVRNALVVPVASLLALSSGGYALEVVHAGGVHHLEAVDLGIFDDTDGLVQVTGKDVVPGQRVVVPGE